MGNKGISKKITEEQFKEENDKLEAARDDIL